MSTPNTPLLIGGGQYKEQDIDPREASSPQQMMREAAHLAAINAGLDPAVLAQLDLVITTKSVSDPTENPPEALANALASKHAKTWHCSTGGNSPQWLVNRVCEQIARGEVEFVLLAGVEALDALTRAAKAGIDLDWTVPTQTPVQLLFPERPSVSAQEEAHGLAPPVNTYPLFEQAIRGHCGRSLREHQAALGELCAPFTEVAAEHPCAWFRTVRTAEEIATATSTNRYVGFPYTKFMNAMINVNQSAAVLLCSEAFAQQHGVAQNRKVYLHGCGDCNDHWNVLDRVNYHSSPAIRRVASSTLGMANVDINDIDFIDLYSCFPSAVEIGRNMFGIPPDDPRPLTVTGGLPYFGGPGNNYVMHSIATMLDKVREHPGSFGLVTGNGWYITKHSAGVYSTNPVPDNWERTAPNTDQAAVDAEPGPEVVAQPTGAGNVETYTVLFGRDGAPHRGIVIGRTANGQRFIAVTPGDVPMLEQICANEFLGATGAVSQRDGLNLFVPS